MTVAAFVLCHALLRSRAGYYWQAIRESPEAAQALGIDIFRYKMYAVVLSAAMTSLGGVLFAFYYNNLFPEQVFHISPLDRADPGPDHRRHRHAVRPDRRRVPAHGAGRGAARGHACASASTCPASSRCSTASACCSSSCSCPTASGRR